jgi:hypothetical protein
VLLRVTCERWSVYRKNFSALRAHARRRVVMPAIRSRWNGHDRAGMRNQVEGMTYLSAVQRRLAECHEIQEGAFACGS